MFHNRTISRLRTVAAFAAAVFLFEPAYAQSKLKVGVISSLTGFKSASGQAVKNSVLLAQEKFDTTKSVEFLFEDDQFEPKNSITIAKKFIELDKINALIVWGTPTSLAVTSIAEKSKTPMIGFSMVEKLVVGKTYTMRHWLPAESINRRITSEVTVRGYKTVSIVAEDNDAMIKLKDLFVESKVATVLSKATYPKSETDFKTEIAKIKAQKPDAVYALIWAPQLSLFVKELRAAQYRGEIFGTQNMEDKNEIVASNGSLNGAWFAGTDDSHATEYLKLYYKRFSTDPVAGGGNAYDVAKIFIDCANSDDLNNCIHSVKNFNGALGNYSATERNDFDLTSTLRCIKNGEIVASGC